jgi:hypothetical protein
MTSDRRPFHALGRLPVALALVVTAMTGDRPARAQEAAPPAQAGQAAPGAVVHVGHARFTVLTSRLVRLEWAADGRFEDRPSLVFINRRLPVPSFQSRRERGWTTIDTGALLLRYRPDGTGEFTARNLSIALTVAGRQVTWHPGMPDTGNLRGTTRTLDGVKGATSLEPGLVSRDGWVVVDDTARPLFDDSDWPWAVARPERPAQDWYFFGHGHDYRGALGDFVKVAGRIPIPPRFAFGTWWSRYWSYTDQELMDLVGQFESHDVPLDVLVIDMDWHLTFNLRWDKRVLDQSGNRLGWSGYTWDPALFPDPEGFLSWCEAHGLKTPLNLHPASGVQPHERAYAAMARAMGIDPATKKYVPFDITDKRFAENYLELLHRPLERQGVDFWWLDWQQYPETKVPGVNNTWWLNYVHSTDMERRGLRPLIFHRWGGLGNHRYQIGFSGDTESVWESLAFQPYFTATAANVGYAYWSHDIGGHMPGVVSPELYLRWIQFGAFSPILRTHTTKNPDAERRIWAYPEPYASVMRDAFLLRYALIPYLYSAARETYDSGVAFLRPLYYDFPEREEAYQETGEYSFGDSLLVAPITAPVDSDTGTARQSVWLPPGTWIEWFTGATLDGPARLNRRFGLEEVPVYAKAGAVVPMQPEMRNTREKPVDPLILTVFPGAEGGTRVYEDQGDSLGYKSGEFAWTPVSHTRAANGDLLVEVGAAEGRYPGMPASRGYEIRLPAMLPPRTVSFEGQAVAYVKPTAACEAPCWTVEGRTLTTIVRLPRRAVTSALEVRIVPADATPDGRRAADGFAGRIARLLRAMHTLNATWPKDWSPASLVEAVQTPRRIEIDPRTAAQEIETLTRRLPAIVADIRAMEVDATVTARAIAQLGDDARQR